jgi:hypothetical protein
MMQAGIEWAGQYFVLVAVAIAGLWPDGFWSGWRRPPLFFTPSSVLGLVDLRSFLFVRLSL